MDIKHNVEKYWEYTAVVETTDNEERKYISTIIDKRKIDSEEERKKGIEINNIFEGREHTNGATWIDTNSIDIDDAIENMKEANEDALRELDKEVE